MNIITISREFGSGGRELGKRLAEALGYAYYDREILTILAQKTDMAEEYLERALEQGNLSNLYPISIGQTFAMLPTYMADQSSTLLRQQSDLIKSIAQKQNCVIVGRNADIILADEQPLRLFVHAEMSERIARCRRRETPEEQPLTDKAYEKQIRQIDKSRSKLHNILSSYQWGDRRGYDLCINTTTMRVKDMIPALAAYTEKWFSIEK